MFVTISVGQKTGLAVIPSAFLKDHETIKAILPNLSMRINMMVKGRVEFFQYTVMGNSIERVGHGQDMAIINTIADCVEHAKVLCHDHVTFEHVHDLVEFATRSHADSARLLSKYRQHGDITGTISELSREEERRFTLVERAKAGINQPTIIW